MKNYFFILISLVSLQLFSQNNDEIRPVLTGAPFLRIAPDARSGGLGDQGVATTGDAFSQYWNAAKYNFASSTSGLGISYTPYLSKLTNDVFLLNAAFFTQVGDEERSTIGASIYYFNIGEIQLNNIVGTQIVETGIAKPNEFAIDVSYGLKLSDYYSMAVTGRFIRSDLYNNISDSNNSQTKAASSFAVDLAGYYQGEEHTSFGYMDGRVRAGFQVSNIGPKLDYSDNEENASYLPTNLRLGVGYDLLLDDENKIGVTFETSKLLVPTPQEDGTIPNKSVIDGMFSSFGDAPGGGSEELKEFTYSLSAEYAFNNTFAFRTGYFHENRLKGARQFLTLGLGLKYNSLGFDASYLITTSQINNALDNTLRFGITWDIGEETDYTR
ncbi:MAG: type IX secretion system outer membrane channel protein PorV [Flavobacteriales bacterium]|nr:type IX secretion system outer membrane channel protein PorV [Flavobacteriales bacterium]